MQVQGSESLTSCRDEASRPWASGTLKMRHLCSVGLYPGRWPTLLRLRFQQFQIKAVPPATLKRRLRCECRLRATCETLTRAPMGYTPSPPAPKEGRGSTSGHVRNSICTLVSTRGPIPGRTSVSYSCRQAAPEACQLLAITTSGSLMASHRTPLGNPTSSACGGVWLRRALCTTRRLKLPPPGPHPPLSTSWGTDHRRSKYGTDRHFGF